MTSKGESAKGESAQGESAPGRESPGRKCPRTSIGKAATAPTLSVLQHEAVHALRRGNRSQATTNHDHETTVDGRDHDHKTTVDGRGRYPKEAAMAGEAQWTVTSMPTAAGFKERSEAEVATHRDDEPLSRDGPRCSRYASDATDGMMMRIVHLKAAWQRQDANAKLRQALKVLRCEAEEAERMKSTPTKAETSGLEQLHNALRVEVSNLERPLLSVAIRVQLMSEQARLLGRHLARPFELMLPCHQLPAKMARYVTGGPIQVADGWMLKAEGATLVAGAGRLRAQCCPP